MARAEDPLPTRTDFIREVLDPKPSPTTPKFHDDTRSYHVIKEDLAKGLFEEAEKRKLDLRGVLIAGPMSLDPLWTYTVVAFIREGDRVRANVVVFPHARITYKSTGLVTVERYEKWVAEMEGTGVLKPKLPSAARGEKDEAKRDRMFTLLFASLGPGGKDCRSYYADPQELEEGKRGRFQEVLNGILENQEETYSVYKD
jgi:hypothetical protein